MTQVKRVLFVCLGNICRSPMAHGIFRHLAKEKGISIFIDSAGTSGFHEGETPDARAQKTMKEHGISIHDLHSRPFSVKDFDDFDLILVMDDSNYSNVLKLSRNETDKTKVHRMMSILHESKNEDVPDPWFGGQSGFTQVYNMLYKASEAWLDQITKQ